MDPDAKNLLQKASAYSYLGIFMGVAVLLGFLGGRWLDDRLGTKPWLMLFGLLVGILAGFRELYLLARRGMRDEKGGKPPGSPGPATDGTGDQDGKGGPAAP